MRQEKSSSRATSSDQGFINSQPKKRRQRRAAARSKGIRGHPRQMAASSAASDIDFGHSSQQPTAKSNAPARLADVVDLTFGCDSDADAAIADANSAVLSCASPARASAAATAPARHRRPIASLQDLIGAGADSSGSDDQPQPAPVASARARHRTARSNALGASPHSPVPPAVERSSLIDLERFFCGESSDDST